VSTENGPAKNAFRVGVDIGGTFSDLVIERPDGSLDKRKVATTPEDYSLAIFEGVIGYCEDQALDSREITEIVHATTVATNAILERRGARTALITTEGFRDVLELRRIRVPLSYDLSWAKPEPLVPRARRFTVDERIDAMGNILKTLDEAEVRAIAETLREEGVEAIAVCLLHAYREPANERLAGEALRLLLPGIHVSLSHEVLPEMLEYERTSTTVVNAYVAPTISRYLRALREGFTARGVNAPILVMQSSGGLISAGAAAERPAAIIESGPAAGVVAAAQIAGRIGRPNVITFDMGGTTTKASIIEGGRFLRAAEYEVGSPISASSRLGKGGGYVLKMPVIDITEVGAGGGSIARLDPGGALRVGPRSAGSDPGPACYGKGNTEPTVTDANLVLGYLGAGSLAGGSLSVDLRLARDAVERAVGSAAGFATPDAAWGIHQVANSNMVRAIKSVSVERGRDPADYALIAFGGAGPIHAAALARELGIGEVIVPPASGVLSALGLLEAEIQHHLAHTVLVGTREASQERLEAVFGEMNDELTTRARNDGLDPALLSFTAHADLRYKGQSSELSVALDGTGVGEAALRAAEDRFEAEYERTFGYRSDRKEFQLVTLRLAASLPKQSRDLARWVVDRGGLGGAERDCYFGPEAGHCRTPVIVRESLSGSPRTGPLIVQEYDTTILVPPGALATLDDHGNVVIAL
jgi:N-methylhydantoinase A